ncbi:MAG TPA: 2,5-diamino-6-(ribosylamino)-4(3H)-pyrimidinone 5'-phosphate reductase [Methanoculleus sp.]|mgnify:CR=1 FL=1|nr:2,5-diamino-6-(ribosylamino)-4(3H)-pyrimidinone 5'-phosphate reductase [Methanoculleus sp.]
MRPFILVNCAMSADGKISTKERRQVKISGKNDFLRVDRIKAESDAIMVGIGTVLADNPSLTVKSDELKQKRRARGADENPVRIVVDSAARIPPNAEILHKGRGKRIIAVSSRAPEAKVRELEFVADIIRTGDMQVDLAALMERLHAKGIRSVMVEGGGTLIGSLFAQDLVDEFCTFVGNMVIGGADAPTPADGAGFVAEDAFSRLSLVSAEPLDEGVLLRWKVARSP